MVKLRLGLLLAVVLLFSIACNDDSTELGSGVIPYGDNMEVKFESIKPALFTQFHPDSLQTDDKSSFMLGGLWHKDFGLFKADFVSQLRFDTILFGGANWQLDSVTFEILTGEYYGDSLANSEIKVYELEKDIDNFTDYYSNTDGTELYSESGLLGTLSYSPGRLTDTITDEDLRTYHKFIVPLDKSYGQRLIDTVSVYKYDLKKFQDIFKGIYVKSSFGNKALNVSYVTIDNSRDDGKDLYTGVKLDFSRSYTEIIGYTDLGVAIEKDTTVYLTQYFYVNQECGRFSIFHHDFNNVDINTDIKTDDSPDLVKLRGGGALSLRMRLPDLREDPKFDFVKSDSNFIINKATMTIKLATDEYDYRRLAASTQLEAATDTKDGFIWTDYQLSVNYFGGALNTDAKEYTFNITKFVETLLSDPDFENRDLIFYNEDNEVEPWMAMFYGKDSVDIDIYYTRY